MNKNDITNLALLGGAPLFENTLHVGKPNLVGREKFFERMEDILDRRWYTNNGPYVQEFETKVAEITGVKNCISMCNGTIALEILVRALDLRGEVVVPSFTFVATAHCLQLQKITPVFCDIDPNTHQIDPNKVEQLITSKTTGILAVHLWGRPCNVVALKQVADRHGLKLIFDASHAFSCSFDNTMVGNFGHAETFSFHATKFLNSFEGGAVVTNDDELAGKLRLMRNFGFSGLDNVQHLGTNGKMSEVSAAMGLTSLEGMDSIVALNKKNYELYRRELSRLPGVNLLRFDEVEKNNYQYVVIEIDSDHCGLTRDQLMQLLHAENIRARRYFFPGCHRMEPYASTCSSSYPLLPETEKVASQTLCLPNGNALLEEEILSICNLISFIIRHSEALKGKVPLSVVG